LVSQALENEARILLMLSSRRRRRVVRIEWYSAMLDETDRISLTTSTKPHRRPRAQRRTGWIGASLTASETAGKANVARAEPIGKGALQSSRAPDQPTVAALVANPDRVVDVPVNQIAALLASLASEQARLVAIQGVRMTRLLESQSVVTDESVDQLLTAEEVAKALGVTRRWVQRRARRLPFARRLSEHAVRYSESGLKRWIGNRHMRDA
jgi:predicted DNA-binding transcriptional regulator AlpA